METDQIPNIAVVVDLIAIVVAAFFFWKFCMAKDDLFRHMHDYGVTIDEEMTITSKKKWRKT